MKGGWVKKNLHVAIFCQIFAIKSFPDAIWGKTNCLTISISNLCGLGTGQVLPTRTPSMVLGTYATISLWSISTTCTGYLCRNKVIPFEKNYFFWKVESSWHGIICAILKICWHPKQPLHPGHIKFHANYSTCVVSSAATEDFSFCICIEENHIALWLPSTLALWLQNYKTTANANYGWLQLKTKAKG